MSRRLSLAICTAWVLSAAALPAAAGDRPLTVVELFTSQGCSSCPPADQLLGELAARHDVLALSFHVDYWDYIGWRDTFARPEFTKRQQHYAKRFRHNSVYTPQIVVNGISEATGSDRGAVLALLAGATAGTVAVGIAHQGDGLRLTAAAVVDGPAADLWLVSFDREHGVEIAKGENRGRTILYSHVVRGLWKVGSWSGLATEETVQPAGWPGAAGDCWAVILQARGDGRILGAAQIPAQP